MDPVKSAVKRNLTYTLHLDSPTIVMGKTQGINTFLEIITSAVVRKTVGGRVLGSDQRISVYEALKGLTINGAWQSREQAKKGSL
jgi:predicted amidohydrolase YtcJ